MTAADLDRLDNLRAETIELREQLRRLRSASEVSAVNYSHTGEKCGTGDPVANAAVSVLTVDQELSDKLVEMGDIINKVPKMQTREVMRMYYMKGMSYADIAQELHYADRTGPYVLVERYKQHVLTKSRETVSRQSTQNGVK